MIHVCGKQLDMLTIRFSHNNKDLIIVYPIVLDSLPDAYLRVADSHEIAYIVLLFMCWNHPGSESLKELMLIHSNTVFEMPAPQCVHLCFLPTFGTSASVVPSHVQPGNFSP